MTAHEHLIELLRCDRHVAGAAESARTRDAALLAEAADLLRDITGAAFHQRLSAEMCRCIDRAKRLLARMGDAQ